MKKVQIPQLDHCEPGFGNSVGSQEEWNNAYKNWLRRRGFFDELRMMDLAAHRGKNGRLARAKRKKVESESVSPFTESNRD